MIVGKKNLRLKDLEDNFVFTEVELKQIDIIKKNADQYDAVFIETEKSKITYIVGVIAYIILLGGLIFISRGNLQSISSYLLYLGINAYISWEMWTFILQYKNNCAKFIVKWVRRNECQK